MRPRHLVYHKINDNASAYFLAPVLGAATLLLPDKA